MIRKRVQITFCVRSMLRVYCFNSIVAFGEREILICFSLRAKSPLTHVKQGELSYSCVQPIIYRFVFIYLFAFYSVTTPTCIFHEGKQGISNALFIIREKWYQVFAGFSDRGNEMKEKSNSHVYKATTCELKENTCWSNTAMRIQQNEKHFSNRSNIIQFKFRS